MTATTMDFLDQLTELSEKIGCQSIAAAQILAKDFLGVAVAGSLTPEGQIIYRYATEIHRRGPCNVAGWPETLAAPTAALAKSIAGLAGTVLNRGDVDRLEGTIDTLSNAPSLSALTNLLGRSIK